MIEDWPFDALTPMKYGVILADCPWRFELRSERGNGKSPQGEYSCMSLEEIMALPVHQLAARDCWLWMWATAPMLPQAIMTMGAWGFRYVSAGPWAKQSKTGRKWAFGTGYVFRSAAEFFLLGAMGSPACKSHSERNLIVAPVREHSRKPDEAYEMLERIAPKAWRCELFARQRRPGWDAWGNEVGKFGVAA
jgi:N6-adenosine-specific RNA methylase IME4